MRQVTVAGMKFHSVKSSLPCTYGGASVLADNPFDILLPHGVGNVIAEAHGRRCYEGEAGDGSGCLPARMTELYGYAGASGMHSFSQTA